MAKKLGGNTAAHPGVDRDRCDSVQAGSVCSDEDDWLVVVLRKVGDPLPGCGVSWSDDDPWSNLCQ